MISKVVHWPQALELNLIFKRSELWELKSLALINVQVMTIP
jgi:hypothetical protein